MNTIRHFIAVFLGLTSLFGCSAEGPSSVEEGDANPVGSVSEALTPNALTRAESKTVLKLIDDICGDTWCEGDNDFGFRKITCNERAGTCTMTFQIFPREGVESAQTSYWRSCKTHDFTGFDSLVTTAPNGYQSLDQDYYDALSECISRIEDKLR